MEKSKIRKIYTTISIIVFNSLLLLVILEFGLRAVWSIRIYKSNESIQSTYPTPKYYVDKKWYPEFKNEYTKIVRDQHYDSFILWKQNPHQGTHINFEETGFRRTPDSQCNAKDNPYRVFMFGGSTLWGAQSPDWGTIPNHLNKQLQSVIATPICVTNMGMPAYNSTQELILLIKELQKGNIPRLVIFYDGSNDTFIAEKFGRADVHYRYEHYKNVFESPSAVVAEEASILFRLTNKLIHKVMNVRTPNNSNISNTDLSRNIINTYAENVKIISQLGRTYGFSTFFFWQPSLIGGKKKLSAEEEMILTNYHHLKPLFQSVYGQIDGVLGEKQNFFNLSDVFADIEDQIYTDLVHITPYGNEIIAKQMVTKIKHLIK